LLKYTYPVNNRQVVLFGFLPVFTDIITETFYAGALNLFVPFVANFFSLWLSAAADPGWGG
jgi:membrane-bound metal-dependent hydrolase YbcI (DUF457 family)